MNRFFYGWYMKCQSPVQTLAVIPAVHQVHHHRSCSIQIITDRNAWNVEFSGDIYGRSGKNIFIGKNRFGERGIRLDICTSDITAEGTLSFRCLTHLKYDIMGPFALIPFLECRHHVWSMQIFLWQGFILPELRELCFGKGRSTGLPLIWGQGQSRFEMEEYGSFREPWNWKQLCWSVPDMLCGLR